jgi:hypothetical protein
MMRSSQLHIAALLVIVLLALGFVLGRCSNDSPPRPVTTVKRIPVEVRIPTIVIDHRVDTVRITHDHTDSAAIMRLIVQRDSLRSELERRGVGVAFGLDTVTAYRDTISVWCDEIRRRITASIKFGVRDTTILYVDTTHIIPSPGHWALSAGIGATLSMDGGVVTARPGIFIGLSRTLFNF